MIALIAAAWICFPPTVPNVDVRLMRAVVKNESGFNALAVSTAGAVGMTQLMPATWRALGVCDPRDSVQNIAAGTRYLASLLVRFHGDVRLALSAYNAGPEAVARYGGVPPFEETRTYVDRVLGDYQKSSGKVAKPKPSPTPKPTDPPNLQRIGDGGIPK